MAFEQRIDHAVAVDPNPPAAKRPPVTERPMVALPPPHALKPGLITGNGS
jgi:hypothetical protein